MKIKTDGLLKMSLVFFIAVLSFAVGTFVGKQYSDQQHKLAALEPSKEEAHGNREIASEDGENAKAMTDEELAKLSAEFITDDEAPAAGEHDATADAHGAAPAGEHGATTVAANEHAPAAATAGHGTPAAVGHGPAAVAPAADATTHAPATAPAKPAPATVGKVAPKENVPGKAIAISEAQAMIEGKIPVETAKIHQTPNQTREPSSIPKNLSAYNVGKFTVQLASFTTEAEAKKRATDLKSRGFSAFFIPADVNGKTYYRVSVGLFSTEKEAKEYRQQLLNNGDAKEALVQKVTR